MGNVTGSGGIQQWRHWELRQRRKRRNYREHLKTHLFHTAL